MSITPLEYATRAHEILEDAVRDLLSGVDVPWSGEGVLATAAGLEATEEVVGTLRSLLKGREGVVPLVEVQLAALRRDDPSLAAAHGGRLPAQRAAHPAAGRVHSTPRGGCAGGAGAGARGAGDRTAAADASDPATDVRIDP